MKPWELPHLIKQENRWVVSIPIDSRTAKNIDVTEDMNGWLKQERERLWEALKAHWRGDMGPAHIIVKEIEHLFKP